MSESQPYEVYGCPACGIRSWRIKGGDRHWPTCRYHGDNSWPGVLVPTAPQTAVAAVTPAVAKELQRSSEVPIVHRAEPRETVTECICGTSLAGKHSQARYCSSACRMRAHRAQGAA